MFRPTYVLNKRVVGAKICTQISGGDLNNILIDYEIWVCMCESVSTDVAVDLFVCVYWRLRRRK